jgi:glycosyltransferase involved in cell wall biosynthesis
MSHQLSRVAFIGNYLPRKCGIATFTHDLSDAVMSCRPDLTCSVVAMNDSLEGYAYPPRVRFQITQNKLDEYRNAADFLNMTNFEVVCVQHEFGIYGGPAGIHLLTLLRELRMPIVTTLHTVLTEPNPEYRRAFDELLRLSDRVVVMGHRAQGFLHDIYGIPDEKVLYIPHGVPDLPFTDPNFYKDLFGVEGRKVILTFGLLSPGKGVEHMIEALPAVVARHPDIAYIILGATHPHILRESGQEYRFSLQRRVKELGISDNVIFQDRFVESEELYAFLGAADICVTPYLNEAQITSGVLSFCLGCGKAVVSTPYWHAQEALAEKRGILVPFSDSPALSDALLKMLDNEVERHAMRKRAYTYSREMVWREVGRQYLEAFAGARDERKSTPRRMSPMRQGGAGLIGAVPDLKFDHMKRMTDSTGIIHHAKYTVSDRSYGYTVDDNARALVAAVYAHRLMGPDAAGLGEMAATYLSFLDHAFVPTKRRFYSEMSYDRRWGEEYSSEETHGRALWGLGCGAGFGRDEGLVAVAARLFDGALPAASSFTCVRGIALAIAGIQEYLRRFSGDIGVRRAREELANRLYEAFQDHADDEWYWPEGQIGHVNARLPQALLFAGQWMQRPEMIECGLRALGFLLAVQKSDDGSFQPVGSNGGFPRGGEKARFDQRPIEAATTLDACVQAWHVTRDQKWLDEARMCYEWFLGRNDLGTSLYDHASGGCRDGLHADRVNQNEGAEATLAWLLSAMSMETVKAEEDAAKHQAEEEARAREEQAAKAAEPATASETAPATEALKAQTAPNETKQGDPE